MKAEVHPPPIEKDVQDKQAGAHASPLTKGEAEANVEEDVNHNFGVGGAGNRAFFHA